MFLIHDLATHADWGELKSAVSTFPQTAKVPHPDSRDLPLHLALSLGSCPSNVISSIIEAYPEAVDSPSGSTNEYPLSTYLRTFEGTIDVTLLNSLATEVSAKGVSTLGETPLLQAISKKTVHVEDLKCLVELYPDACSIPDEMDQVRTSRGAKSPRWECGIRGRNSAALLVSVSAWTPFVN
ncbi:hypothetical protein TL16_g08544 [Triparma laevis f. inornata]|uniref:Uncharacterized protein n=1 Tax=Triparma laevis f. inornata TaxID=1714386 RepID=A0A9W7B1K7_9STRA|nr:hypothetical protein TL16_g08544 [Triparma laevis f. inornata]